MKNEANNQKINILDIIFVFLGYWPVLLISVMIFLAAAIFYLKFASRTYSVFSRIIINTEQLHVGGSSAYVNVNDLMNQEKSFTNETTFLRSTPLIKEVIKDMNLNVSYYTKVDKIPKEFKFSLINIYNKTPFIVVIDEDRPQPINILFFIKVIDDERFVISSEEDMAFIYNYAEDKISDHAYYVKLEGVYKFGETIRGNNYSFSIVLNSNYNAERYLGKDLFFKLNSPTLLAYDLQKALTVKTAFFESSVADLTFEWGNLGLSLDFLHSLIDKYIEKNLEKKNFNANNTIEYINRQLASISGSLGQSEQQLQTFRTSRDVMNVSEKASSLYAQIQGLENNRDEIQIRYQTLTQLNDYFEANKDQPTFIPPATVGTADATLTTLIGELTTLSTERQNLVNTNQLRNPRIKTLDANIASIKNVISENISFSKTATLNELAEINERLRTLNAEFSSLPQTQRQLVGLEREFNINDAVYSSLLEKKMQAQIIKASNLSDCEVLEPPRFVEISSPSAKKVGVIAIFLGLLFPSIYIVIVNFLSQKIRTREDLKRYCAFPSVGHIPHNDTEVSFVISNAPQSPIAERFRSIRSNLIYYLLGEANKCILVTSTLPNEGKSFISLNLALSFASTQSSTVLLNLDLRKNNTLLDELKTTNSSAGLSSYLIHKATLEDITIKTSIPNLDYISCGQIPPDPVALISSPHTTQLIKTLKSKYDYIIIDTPPFGLVTDAFLLMQYADISLYVTRLGIITKTALRQSIEEITSKNIERIYCIQNDTTLAGKTYSKEYAYNEKKKSWLRRLFSKRR